MILIIGCTRGGTNYAANPKYQNPQPIQGQGCSVQGADSDEDIKQLPMWGSL